MQTYHEVPAPEASCRGLSILGSTGSIGTQALEVVRLFPGRFRVRALAANSNVDLLVEQARAFRPDLVAVGDASRYEELATALEGTGIRVVCGQEGVIEAATLAEVNTVLAAIVGFAGMEPVLAAIRAGKEIALANKETLVVAGELVSGALLLSGATMVPVDSEHSAIFQCLQGEPHNRIEKLILTASGGPFRNRSAESFATIRKEEALRHPNWSMGAKITIDSATMMNKGLEVIEAHWLFEVAPGRIEVLVHPQSIIHSMVSFEDGSTKAQLGVPDMKVPIQYALSYPDRWPAPHERIDWTQLRCLDFEQPDMARFPCLPLAYAALSEGGTAPAILNAANEQAVALFLEDRIRFTDIPVLIEAAVGRLARSGTPVLEDLREADANARRLVMEHSRSAVI